VPPPETTLDVARDGEIRVLDGETMIGEARPVPD
jgi:hypothetical protein